MTDTTMMLLALVLRKQENFSHPIILLHHWVIGFFFQKYQWYKEVDYFAELNNSCNVNTYLMNAEYSLCFSYICCENIYLAMKYWYILIWLLYHAKQRFCYQTTVSKIETFHHNRILRMSMWNNKAAWFHLLLITLRNNILDKIHS